MDKEWVLKVYVIFRKDGWGDNGENGRIRG